MPACAVEANVVAAKMRAVARASSLDITFSVGFSAWRPGRAAMTLRVTRAAIMPLFRRKQDKNLQLRAGGTGGWVGTGRISSSVKSLDAPGLAQYFSPFLGVERLQRGLCRGEVPRSEVQAVCESSIVADHCGHPELRFRRAYGRGHSRRCSRRHRPPRTAAPGGGDSKDTAAEKVRAKSMILWCGAGL